MNAAGAIAALGASRLTLVTTSECAALWRVRPGAAGEMLRRLARVGLVTRLRRGLWALGPIDLLAAIERLAEPDVAYVSLRTAMRLHGMIEQIPGTVEAMTTGRSRRVRTPLGVVSFRHVDPRFFGAFTRVRGIPVASPEKALVDFLYLSATRDRTFAALPELSLPAAFRPLQARRLCRSIPNPRLRVRARRKLDEIL